MGGLGWFRVIKVPPGPAGSRSVRRSQGKKSNYRRSFKLGQPTLTRVSSLAFVVDLPDLAKATPQQTASTSLSTAVRCTSHCSQKLQKAQVLQFQDGLHSFPMPAARGSAVCKDEVRLVPEKMLCGAPHQLWNGDTSPTKMFGAQNTQAAAAIRFKVWLASKAPSKPLHGSFLPVSLFKLRHREGAERSGKIYGVEVPAPAG
eukprot:s7873_g2.t1